MHRRRAARIGPLRSTMEVLSKPLTNKWDTTLRHLSKGYLPANHSIRKRIYGYVQVVCPGTNPGWLSNANWGMVDDEGSGDRDQLAGKGDGWAWALMTPILFLLLIPW